MNLLDLNEDILLTICEFCNFEELQKLYLTCVQLHNLIKRFDRHLLKKKSSDLLMTGHRNNGKIQQKTLHNLTYMKRLKLSHNWRQGKYDERVFFKHNIMYPSQILLEKDLFYMSHGGQLRVHRRLKSKNLVKERAHEVIGNTRSGDITGFVKKQNTIFGGRDDGYAFIWENGEYYVERISDHIGQRTAFINSVDFHDNVYITASITSMKIWQKTYELNMVSLEPIVENDGYYKSLRISPNGADCAAGKYSDLLKEALRLLDIETNTERVLSSQTTSVYNILWRDNNTLLTANYDSTLRLFDIRSNVEQVWMDPYNASIYHLDYDGMYGVLCGTMNHCRVSLFDLRMAKKFVQLYFPSLQKIRGSPAYSIACDSSQLFIATDHNLRILNFDADWAQPRDYYDIFNFR